MANRTLRLGILSTAGIARRVLIPAFNQCQRVEVFGVASRDAAKAQAFADQLNIPNVYASYEAMLADQRIDAVYIALPTSMHAEWSVRCAEAGKAVLCEKPMAGNHADAVRVSAFFRERNLVFAEAMMFRYDPMLGELRDLIAAGVVGEVRLIRSSFVFSNPNVTDHRRKAEDGAGSLLDVGVYCISALRALANAEPERVAAGANWLHPKFVDDSLVGILHFPGGIVAHFCCSISTWGDCMLEVAGTKGRLIVEKMIRPAGKEQTIKIVNAGGERLVSLAPVNPYVLMAQDFFDAVLDKRPLSYSVEDSIQTMSVVKKLFAAAATD